MQNKEENKNFIDIKLSKDYITDNFSGDNYLDAIMEIVWNSIDADASEISIDLTSNVIGSGIDSLSITDNGHGIEYEKIQEYLKELGKSAKKNSHKSPKGRIYHGKKGKGRFYFLNIGEKIKWETVARDKNGKLNFYEITSNRQNPNRMYFSDIKNNQSKETFTKVTIDNLLDKPSRLKAFELKEYIIRKALNSLLSYNIFLTIDGERIDYDQYILKEKNDIFETPLGGTIKYKFEIKLVQIKDSKNKKIILCDENHFPINEEPFTNRLDGFDIIPYISSSFFSDNEKNLSLNYENDLVLLRENIRGRVRDFVREIKSEQSKGFLDELKSRNLFPYKNPPENPIEKSEQEIFTIIAYETNQVSNILEKDDQAKLYLNLLKETLHANPSNVGMVLKEVLNLKEEDLNDLVDLLSETSFSNIIKLSSITSDRLKILDGISLLLFDHELKKKVRERSMLHKVLVDNLWILGEDYLYGTDDQTLKNVLKQHIKILGRDSNDIPDESHLTDIPDIFIYKKYLSYDGTNDTYRNLIIEIKRPSNTAGQDELSQIERYATNVMNEPAFDKVNTKWEFILLVTGYNEKEIGHKMKQVNREFGTVLLTENFSVKVLRWGDIIEAAKKRLNFFKKQLLFENAMEKEETINFLKKKYSFLSTI
jgi:hypothetical protein